MPLIRICHSHNLGHQQARKTVQKIADELAERHGVDCNWQGDWLNFRRHGLDGSIQVQDDQVTVLANLGLALLPLRGRLTQEVKTLLDRHFPATGTRDKS